MKTKISLPAAKDRFSDVADKPGKLVDRSEAFQKSMTAATVAGLAGETFFDGGHETGTPLVKSRSSVVRSARRDLELAKAADPAVMAALNTQLAASRDVLSKEWTLSNPVSTGLVPFDLEAPAKLLTPRPTPLRNAIPRVKGQGAARRFKVISGFTGTGTGGATTLQPGITESTTNVGPGGLAYIRPYMGAAA